MFNYRSFTLIVALFSALLFHTTSFGADEKPKGKGKTVKASVVSDLGGGGIHARKVPGEFTIPEGSMATNFKYKFYDSKHNLTPNKLSSTNIYSITEKRYVAEAAGNTEFSLPPGKYKFVVGGLPGANGYLSFRIVPYKKPFDDEKLAKDADRVIDTVVWNDTAPDIKVHETYYIRDGKVTGRFDQTFPSLGTTAKGAVIEPPRHQGTFEGKISGNVITGTWKVTFLPQRCTFTDHKGVQRVRIDDGEMTATTRLVLSPGGTLSETAKGSGVTRTNWPNGPLPGTATPQRTSDTFDFAIPGKEMPKPYTGTWKDRK